MSDFFYFQLSMMKCETHCWHEVGAGIFMGDVGAQHDYPGKARRECCKCYRLEELDMRRFDGETNG